MGRFDVSKAMEQITNYEVTVKVKRLEQCEIDMYSSRPRKRNAKRRYDTLSFDKLDDDRFFEMACEEPTYHTITRRRKRKRKVDNDVDTTNPVPQEDRKSIIEPTKPKVSLKWVKMSEQPSTKVELEVKAELVDAEMKPLRIKREVSEPQPIAQPPARLRVKTAAELGSTLVFVDCLTKPRASVSISFQRAFSSLADRSVSSSKSSGASNTSCSSKLNIKVISMLYKKFFTHENQFRIRRVAEILRNVTENAGRNQEKIREINNRKCTDAEKLMLRCQAYADHKRKLEANHAALKQQFETIVQIFDNENFEILFQLFFLGILKIFLVSAPNKKGSLFKKIVSQLSSSLDSSGYKNDRVSSILKAKQFRDECIALVQFIEKYSETEFFEMLFLSDSDKIRLLKKREPACEELSKKALIHGSFIHESDVEGDMRMVRSGNHLLLPYARDAAPKQIMLTNSSATGSPFQPVGESTKKTSTAKPPASSMAFTKSVNIVQQTTPRTVTVVAGRSNAVTSSGVQPGLQRVTIVTSKPNTINVPQSQPTSVIHKTNYVAADGGTQAPRTQLVRPTMDITISAGSAQQSQHVRLSPNLNVAVSSSGNLTWPTSVVVVRPSNTNQFGANVTASTPGIGALQPNLVYLPGSTSSQSSIPAVNRSSVNSTNQTAASSLSSRTTVIQPISGDRSFAPRTALISVKKDLMPPTTSAPPPPYPSSQAFLPFAPISSNTSNSHAHQPISILNVISKPNELTSTLSSTLVAHRSGGTNNENIMPTMQPSEYVKTKTTNGDAYVPMNASSTSNLRTLLTDSSYFNQQCSPPEVPTLPRDRYFNGPRVDPNASMTAIISAPSVSNATAQIANCGSRVSGAGAAYAARKQGCDNQLCPNEATVVCSGCSNAYYCGHECQKMAWAYGHNNTCNMPR